MRTQFVGNRSFAWLYSAPWDSLPSALVGLIVAFIHFNQQTDGVRPGESMVRNSIVNEIRENNTYTIV